MAMNLTLRNFMTINIVSITDATVPDEKKDNSI